jgi:outer membrane protein assembly factor BamA
MAKSPRVSVAVLPRRLARLAGFLVVLILIGLAVLHLPPVRGRMLDRARGYAERELGISLRASSLHYNLLTRSIELRDLSVAPTSVEQPFLEADRAVVVLGTGIFRGRTTVTRISLTRPRLTLVRYADGTVNLPPSRNSAGQTAPLQLGIVSVTALSARVDDRLAQRSFTIGPLDLSVDTAATSGRPGAFGPGAFTVRAGDIDMTGTIAGRLAFDGSRVRIEDLTAESREGRIVLAGWADVIGERPAISSRINATVNLPEAARLAGVDARGLTGHLESRIDVTGALATPAVAIAVTSRDAAYPPIGPVRVAGRSSLSGSRALIDAVDIDSGAGSLHVQGAIELGETTPRAGSAASRLALRWANLHIDDLAQAFGSPLPIRSGSSASGSAILDFDAGDRASLAWSRLRATATTALEPAANDSIPGSLALSGEADLKLDQGRWSLRHVLHSTRAQADLAGAATGRLLDGADELRSTLGGRSRIRVSDISALPPLIQSAGVKLPPDVVEGLAGSMVATADLAGTIERPHARIDLAVRDLRARRLPQAAALDAKLDVDANGLRAPHVQATAGTTSLKAAGEYSWRGPFAARLGLTQGDLSEIASQFGSPVTVSGSARLEGTISGVARRAQAVFALSTRDLAVEQISIGALAAKGTLTSVEDGLMTVDAAAPGLGAHVQLEIVNRAGYPVSGEVTLEHDRIGALIPPQYRQLTGDISGKLSAIARGSGHLSDPAGIRGRIDLHELDVMVRGTRLALAAPASVTLARDQIVVDSVDLRAGQRTRATLDGQLGETILPEPLRLQLNGPISELIEIGSGAAGVAPVPVQGEGTARLDLTVGGTLGRPLPNGNVVVRSPSLQYGTVPVLTGLALDASIDPTLITLRTVAAQWQGASLGAEGALPWRVVLRSMQSSPEPATLQSSRVAGWLNALPPEPARASLTVRADNITQAVLKDLVSPAHLHDVEGTASATVAVEADRLTLERVQATAVLDRASLTLAGVPFTQSVPTRLRLENGQARIDDFQWNAEGNSIVASGGANLTAARPSIDLGVSGVLDLRVLGAFVTGVTAGGLANANLTVAGPADDPDIVGSITLADGDLQLDSPRLAASDLKGTVQVATGRNVTVSLAGLVNTGSATLDGTVDLAELTAPLGKLQFTARDLVLEYPSGLQTESNVDIGLALAGKSSTLSGRIDVLGGTYREPLVLTSQLLNLSSPNGIARTAPPPDWLNRLRLNVTVATASDVRIENNYGRLDLGAALRLVGTAARPGVLGRMLAADDGEIYLGGNTYRIERLAIDLTNPRGITPEVNFSAQTRIGNLPIGVEMRCPAAGPCERKVTSLATGVDDKEAESRLFGTAGGAASAGEGLARLLSGEILGVVGRTVGLDAIRLEQAAEHRDIFDDPTLISGDVDPAARLTLAKRLGSNVELVFSQNLADDGFTWITSYAGPYGLSWRLLVLDDQSRAYEFRHEPPIGAGRTRRRPRPPGPRIAIVRIVGTPGFPENEIRRQLRLTEGDRFTFLAWQRDRDRLERFYRTQGFLDARIRARRLTADRTEVPAPNEQARSPDEKTVLEYAITRGPTTQLTIRGATLPDAVRDRILGRWATALFDGFLERDARTIVLEHFYREGYLHATVAAAVALDASREVKTLTIDVAPGSIVPWRIDVAGNSGLPSEQLLGIISKQDTLSAWLDRGSVERLLEDHYRSEGFLAADVSVAAPETRDGTSVVTIEVVEGAPYSIGEIGLSGVPLPEQEAREALAISTGERYRPAGVAEGVNRLEARLRRAAYREASAEVDTHVDEKAARVDIAVRVTPGPRSILRDVVVQGGDASKPPLAGAIGLAPNAPLDPAAVGATRRRLYDLDVYRSVDIEVQPLPVAAPPASASAPLEQPVIARIALEERPRYRLRYGLAISDEEVGSDERDRRLGFAADLENRNIFGRGATAGLSLRLRRDQQVGRVTLGAKRLFALPIRSTLFVEREREQLNPEGAFPITSDITALTAEQAYRVRPGFEFRYGYGIERNHTFIRSEETDPFDLTVKIARFTTSGLVDRRDDAFNPARGWFAASALELSRPGLGSDLSFLKDFAQYSHFVPVGQRLVLASAARLGLARTFDDEVLIPSERFYAGGANSVRGYREDDLGPRSVLGDADGGYALLVLNGELRFPVYRWLKGVGFVDVGNVYPKISDISLSDLQIGIGAGARFDTPFGLIRFDLGVPANRRSFDPRWRIHVGLGHAF